MKTKEIGVKDKCFCGTDVICGWNRDNTKLQWQGMDGKAHYNYDTNTKKTTCKGTEEPKQEVTQADGFVGIPPKTNPVRLADIDLPHETKVKVCDTCKNINNVIQVIEWQAWEQLGFDASPARVGMYINNACKKLLNVPNLEEILADMGDKDASP